MNEITAVKTEVREAMVRRLKADGRTPDKTFGVATTALSELLAELIFAGAKDKAHGNRLLTICNACIESRWRALASSNATPVPPERERGDSK